LEFVDGDEQPNVILWCEVREPLQPFAQVAVDVSIVGPILG